MSELSGKIIGTIKRNRWPIAAVLIVALLFGGMVAYSGLWPPVYVVESASMQHSDEKSAIGLLDTGDLVVVKGTDGGGVRTYVECFPDGDKSFGDYGDVIVYEPYGRSDLTPIIHRAMLRLEYNETSKSFDAPSLAGLPADKWGNGVYEDGRWWDLSGIVEIYDVGYRLATLRVDLADLLSYYNTAGLSHDGIITMGDHNVRLSGNEWVGVYDQTSSAICRSPVEEEWIVGEAKLELPWLGLIKLWVNGNMPADTPDNSKTDLMVLVALLITVPLAFDITISVLRKKGIDPWAKLRNGIKRKK
ncbi:MAG: S26 family signal peptidase [Methanomassiliicoccales archaeon]|nr:S26 family signal peptidase [Methanomassiliicoccales archaeon]